MTYPPCDRATAYHDDLRRTLVSLFGPVRYRRAYYYCRCWGSGLCPFDVRPGLGDPNLTPAVERLASLAGGVSPASRGAPGCLRR